MHSPFVKQMLNLWSVCNRIIPNDWKDSVNGILKTSTQLQWNTWFREEVKIVEQQSKARSRNISQNQILGEGDYATIETQAVYDDHTLDLCHAAALNAWDKIGEIGKKIESFTKVIQAGPKGNLYRFLTKIDFSSKKNDTKFRS